MLRERNLNRLSQEKLHIEVGLNTLTSSKSLFAHWNKNSKPQTQSCKFLSTEVSQLKLIKIHRMSRYLIC